MGTLYRKSAKGQTEIETRVHRLAPRLRTVLILIDGRRSDNELAKLIPGDAVESFQSLLREGFIEVLSVVEERSTQRPPPPPDPTQPGALAQLNPRALERHRRDAVRALMDQVGPMAEAVAMRIEKCREWSELIPALHLAQQIIANTRGNDAAAEYGRRFIDSPPL